MIAFFSLRAVESVDPWEKIEIDAATRALAEEAAAAAGLSIEEWLERAIERAGASIVRAPRPDAPDTPSAPELEPELEFEIEVPQVAIAAQDDAPVVAAPSDADIAEQERTVGARPYRWVLMAAGIVVAIVGGVVSAQYLIPDRQHAVRVALEPTPPAESTSSPAQESAPPATATTAGDTGLTPNAAPAATVASLEPTAAAPMSATPVAPAPPVSVSSTVAPSPAASQPTSPAASEPTPPAPSQAALPVRTVKTPPANQEPRKTALAKPPAAPGPATPRNPPNATVPDGTTKADKAEAPTDPQLLAPWLEARAKTGDAISQYRLGVLYALGEGVTQDYQRAAALFKTAAEDGVTEAEYNIAVMYAEGLGIGRDPNQAVFWYRKAASQGSASAAFNLGVAYSNGVGVERSMEQAAQWFRRAADAGVVNAQFNIGLLYERGEGVSPSQIEAFGWYAVAAARGDTGAAQRRDRLAGTLSPAVLKDAQARAAQIETNLQNSGSRGAAAPVMATPAAHKP